MASASCPARIVPVEAAVRRGKLCDRVVLEFVRISQSCLSLYSALQSRLKRAADPLKGPGSWPPGEHDRRQTAKWGARHLRSIGQSPQGKENRTSTAIIRMRSKSARSFRTDLPRCWPESTSRMTTWRLRLGFRPVWAAQGGNRKKGSTSWAVTGCNAMTKGVTYRMGIQDRVRRPVESSCASVCLSAVLSSCRP
jgi:hypothetical protein